MEAKIFTVIGEPTRLRIIEALMHKACAVGDLVSLLGSSQPAVSKHLKILRDAGLVTRQVHAQQRIYELNSTPLQEIDEWLEPYRNTWNQSLDALENFLDAEATDEQQKN